jgi:outer membrane cobalamin receptor
MNHFLKVFGLLMGFALSHSVWAQNFTLKGLISDAETNEALVGATIQIPNDNIGAFTNEEGRFQLKIPLRNRNSVNVRFSYAGYAVENRQISLVEGGEDSLEINLSPEGFTTEDVVITATKGFEQKQSDVTVSIQVVKPQSIDLQATTSVAKVIEQIPGVDNQDGQINIRGSSGYAYGVGSRVMVTLDGLPLLTGDAGQASLNLIPVDNIAQVEVMKGASSVLYGSAALGGVINVLTADAGSEPRTRIRLRGGLYGAPANPDLDWDGDASPYESSAHLFHTRKIGTTDLTIQTDFIKNSGYRQGTDQEQFRGIFMTKFRPKSIPGLTIGLNATTSIDSTGAILYWESYYPDTLLNVEGQDSIAGGALRPTTDEGGYRKQLTTLFAIDPSIKYLTKNGNLLWYRGRFLRNSNQNNTNQSSANYILYNDLIYQTAIGKNISWVSGATYSYSLANADSLYGGKHDGMALGVYTQLDGKFGRLNTSLGLRYQTVQIDTLPRESRPILRAGLNFEIREGTNIRASFGQAFRVPTVAERFTSTAGGGVLVEPNPEIKSEFGYSAELAFRQGYRAAKGTGGFQGYVDIAAFLMDYDDMVEFGINSVNLVARPTGGFGFQGNFSTKNVARARITGLEFTTLNGAEFENGFFFNLSGGLTFTNPVNLNAVAPENQMDLSGFNIGGFNIQELNNVLTQIADSSITDQPEILKYRPRFLYRASASIGYKGLGLTMNYRRKSFNESIDQFLYLIVADLGDFRNRHPNGFQVMDLILSYDIKDQAQVSLTVDNLLNEEYTVIPGFLAPQRRATLQLMLKF